MTQLNSSNDLRQDLAGPFLAEVFSLNHPPLRETLNQVLASDLPNLAQMDVSVLAGLLADPTARSSSLSPTTQATIKSVLNSYTHAG